jgi:hypothetical protein
MHFLLQTVIWSNVRPILDIAADPHNSGGPPSILPARRPVDLATWLPYDGRITLKMTRSYL